MLVLFYPTAFKGCADIVFTHGIWMGGQAAGKSLSGLYLRNDEVHDVETKLILSRDIGWGV